jgi:hypothetical protein
MRRLVALFLGLCLAAVAPPSRADLVIDSGDGSMQLRLLDTVCAHAATLALIKPEHRPNFRDARITDRTGAIKHYGCWIEPEAGVAFILFEDGSSTDFKLSKFRDPVV